MTEEIQLSDAEKRLLRRVFHRHALPYIAALGIIALIAISGRSEEAPKSETEEQVAEAPAPSVDVEALLATQGRAEEWIAELQASTEKHKAELGAAQRKIAELEKRLGSTARKLAKVESVARKALEVAAEARAKSPEAVKASAEIPRTNPREAPKESAKITRVKSSEASSPASIQDKLRSLSSQQGETRRGAAPEQDTLPAAPANVLIPKDATP